MFKKLEAVALDPDYAYINTFVYFLERIITIIGGMWDKFVGSLGDLFSVLNSISGDSTTAAEGE